MFVERITKDQMKMFLETFACCSEQKNLVMRLNYAGRKQKKRQFRQLWIARINAAARMNDISYSKLMHGLKLAGVDINRKMLSEMAISDAEGFAKLVEVAKAQLS